MPYISVIVEVCASHIVSELAVAYRLSLLAKINACLVKSDRIKRCEHTDVRKDGRIVFSVTVTVRRYISDEADVETGSAADNRSSIFCHLSS